MISQIQKFIKPNQYFTSSYLLQEKETKNQQKTFPLPKRDQAIFNNKIYYLLNCQMQKRQSKNQQPIQTTVKLFGNQQDNINTILCTLQLSHQEEQNIKIVLSILYSKIEKLRLQRNQLRQVISQKNVQIEYCQTEKEHLQVELENAKKQIEKFTAKPSHFEMADYSFDQTPPMKQAYMSVQFDEDKENRFKGLGEIKVSSFQGEGEQQKQLGGQFGALMKKFNLNIDEFRKVILLYAQEERKVLEALETDEQRDLYMQSKKTNNYEEWIKRMTKKMGRGRRSKSSLTSMSSKLSFKENI